MSNLQQLKVVPKDLVSVYLFLISVFFQRQFVSPSHPLYTKAEAPVCAFKSSLTDLQSTQSTVVVVHSDKMEKKIFCFLFLLALIEAAPRTGNTLKLREGQFSSVLRWLKLTVSKVDKHIGCIDDHLHRKIKIKVVVVMAI